MNKYLISSITLEVREFKTNLNGRLGDYVSLLLSSVGNNEILQQPLLGLFSSVKCPARLILKAQEEAKELSERNQVVISGFQSPVEKEMLEVLLRGTSPIVICPARGLEGMRIPIAWRRKLDVGEMLVLSPFPANIKRPDLVVIQKRNDLVISLASELFIIHAEPGGKVKALAEATRSTGKRISYL